MIPKLNVLFSYAYLRKDKFLTDLLLALSPHLNILIDSGAYTNDVAERKAAATGDAGFEPITLPEYMNYCRSVGDRVWGYITLDKIGDPITTDRNLAAMLDGGLRPMPVFVRGADYDTVPHLIAANERICVGGAVNARYTYTMQRYQRVFEASGGKAQIHALGYVHFPETFQVPVASCDVSSWCGGQQYGHICMFRPDKGFTLLKRSQLGNPKAVHFTATMDHLLRCGITAAELGNAASYSTAYGIPALVTINSYINFHRFATAHQRRFFFAIPAFDWLKRLVCVLSTHRGDGTFDIHAARDRFTSLGRKVLPRKVDTMSARLLELLQETTEL